MGSMAMSYERVSDAWHYRHAEKMADQHFWEEAFQSYRVLATRHTDTETLVSYAEVAMRSGHPEDAAHALEALEGRYVLDDLKYRAETVADQLMNALRPMPHAAPSQGAMIPLRPN